MALDTMIQLFGMKQLGYPTQVRFNGEALIPRSPCAAVDVGRWRIFLAQAQIRQRDCLTIVAGCQLLTPTYKIPLANSHCVGRCSIRLLQAQQMRTAGYVRVVSRRATPQPA